MAKQEDVSKALTEAPKTVEAPTGLKAMLDSVQYRKRFEDMLGKKAAGFISSILTVANQKKELKVCDPKTIIASAAVAASLDLPIIPSLGFAHIVPYKGWAQFQMGWKGFVQLAMRTGQYLTMNVAVVHEGELKKHNRITGEMEFNDISLTGNEATIGYVAYFKLINGFEKYLYMSKADAIAHGKRYSKSFDSGNWKTNFDSMALKTVIKMLLSKFGILSIEIQRAIATDQAVVKEDGSLDYVDGKGAAIEADIVVDDPEVVSENINNEK